MKKGGRTTGSAALSLPNAREPWPGVISAGQPMARQWAGLRAAGIAAVVDIREDWEPRGHDEAGAVERAGLRYVRVPFGHGPIRDETFARVREVMRAARSEPVVVHCASGNRVGAALIPWWILDEGLTEEQALGAAVKAGLSSRPLAMMALDYARRVRKEREAAA